MAQSAEGFRTGWRGARALLTGTFRTLVTGQALGQFGDGLTQISFAQLVVFDIGKGATPGRIAGIFAVTLLPFSVVGPISGVLIDRWDRRRTLVVASLTRAALAVVAISAAIVKSEALAYVGVVLLLSSSRFVLDAKGAVLPRTVPRADLVRANAISGLVGMAAAFVGGIGGAAFVSWSVLVGFLSGAAAYGAASLAFARLPDVGGGRRTESVAAAMRGLAAELATGLRSIARTPDVRRPLAAVWLHRFLLGGGFVLLVLVADRRYHLAASGYGLALGVTGAAAVVGTVSAPLLAGRWTATRLLPLAFLPPAAALGAVGYGPTLPGLIAVVAVAAVSFQVLKVLTDALVGGGTQDAVRGRVFAVYDVLYNLAFVVAGLAMVPVWDLRRERGLLWWLAAAFALAWLLLARVARAWPFSAVRRHPAPGSPDVMRAVPAKWKMRALTVAWGALPVVIFPRPAAYWAAWFVLVPWLVLVRRAPTAREAALRGWWGAVGFLLAVHYWLFPSVTVFLPVIAALLALFWMPWAALTWRLSSAPGGSPWRVGVSAVVSAAGWVLAEAVRSWSALGGPWGLLGTSQWHTPVFLAPAALGGVWLVSFLIVVVNVLALAAIETRALSTRAAAAAAAAIALAVGPASFLLEHPPRGSGRLAVTVVQAGVVHDAQRRLAVEVAATQAAPPARLVVWGESSVGMDLFTDPALQRRLEAVAAQSGGYLLVNVDAAAPGGAIHKTAVLIGRDAILGSYEKMRLVPFGEYIPLRSALGWLSGVSKAAAVNRVRGSQVTVLREPGLPAFSPLICFESAFPDMSRTAARRGADVLLFQAATTTFQGSWAPDQHAGLAAVRAVESGRPALQATLSGTTAAFDAQGRRLLWHPAATGAAAVALPLAARTTPYDRWGDWVLAASVVIVVAACVGLSLGAARREFDGRPDPDEKPTTRHPEPPPQRSVAVTGRS